MSKKQPSIRLDFDLSLSNVQQVNPSFALATVCIAYCGLNRNRSIIDEEAFTRALPSLYNVPLVGYYDEEAQDFGGHSLVIKKQKDGLAFVPLTTPFGVVPESAQTWWEMRDVDGEARKCLCTQVILWKRQNGYELLAERGEWKQSMEIVPTSKPETDKDHNLLIRDFYWQALCILGTDKEPCYEPASLQLESESSLLSYEQQFADMLFELKQAMDTAPFAAALAHTKAEGKDKDMNKEALLGLLAELGLDASKLDFEWEDMSEDELRDKLSTYEQTPDGDPAPTQDPEPTTQPPQPTQNHAHEPESGDPGEPGEPEPTPTPQTFSLTYFAQAEALRHAVSKLDMEERNDDGYCIKCVRHWVSDFDDQYVYIERSTFEDEAHRSEHGRRTYTVAKDGADVTATLTGEWEPMIVRWLTEAEDAALDAQREELTRLRTFYTERTESDHKTALDAVVAEFGDLRDVSEFEQMLGGDKPAVYEFSTADELREKLFALRGRYKAPAPKSKPAATEPLRHNLDPKPSSANASALAVLFERYGSTKL